MGGFPGIHNERALQVSTLMSTVNLFPSETRQGSIHSSRWEAASSLWNPIPKFWESPLNLIPTSISCQPCGRSGQESQKEALSPESPPVAPRGANRSQKETIIAAYKALIYFFFSDAAPIWFPYASATSSS